MALALHELATDAARVLVAHLVHLDGVVTAVERDDELTVLVIGLSGDELGVESEDVHVLLEHFLHVNLGGLGLKVNDGGHGILVSTEARVGGDRLVLNGRGSSGELDGHLSYSELCSIPLLGEFITVKDLAVTTINLNWCATSDVCRHVVFLSTEGHTWAVSQDRLFGKLLALKELGEGGTAAVLCVDLLNLYRVVAKEKVEGVELVTTIVSHILPQDLEAEDTAVIVKEALEATVRSATLQLNLDIVLELSLVGRSLFHIDHAAGMLERIVRVVLSLSNVSTFITIVATSELVAIDDTEDTSVDIEVHAESEIRPVIVTRAIRLGKLSALEENSLRDSRVWDTRLNDVEGVILHVEVDDALPDAVVLIRVLYDGLKEVRLEVQDLEGTERGKSESN